MHLDPVTKMEPTSAISGSTLRSLINEITPDDPLRTSEIFPRPAMGDQGRNDLDPEEGLTGVLGEGPFESPGIISNNPNIIRERESLWKLK